MIIIDQRETIRAAQSAPKTRSAGSSTRVKSSVTSTTANTVAPIAPNRGSLSMRRVSSLDRGRPWVTNPSPKSATQSSSARHFGGRAFEQLSHGLQRIETIQPEVFSWNWNAGGRFELIDVIDHHQRVEQDQLTIGIQQLEFLRGLACNLEERLRHAFGS